MWTTRQGQLAVLFAMLGGAAWWLVQGLIEAPLPRPRARAPTHVVTDLSALETNPEGRPEQRLVAAQSRQFVDEDRSELDAPRLTVFDDAGAPPWQIASDRGLLLADGTEVHLIDHVKLDRTGTDASRSLRLETTELTISAEARVCSGG